MYASQDSIVGFYKVDGFFSRFIITEAFFCWGFQHHRLCLLFGWLLVFYGRVQQCSSTLSESPRLAAGFWDFLIFIFNSFDETIGGDVFSQRCMMTGCENCQSSEVFACLQTNRLAWHLVEELVEELRLHGRAISITSCWHGFPCLLGEGSEHKMDLCHNGTLSLGNFTVQKRTASKFSLCPGGENYSNLVCYKHPCKVNLEQKLTQAMRKNHGESPPISSITVITFAMTST